MEELLRRLCDFLLGVLTKQDLRAAGADGQMVTASLPLGSGFDLDKERAMSVEKLRAECDQVVSDPDMAAHDVTGDGVPETFCNSALQRVAGAMGCHDLDGLMANDMVRKAASSPGWRVVSAQHASEHAMRGGFGFAGKEGAKHGHVAAIYPARCAFSGSWGGDVPMVANVGRTRNGISSNGIKKASEAFLVAEGPPAYFIWGEA